MISLDPILFEDKFLDNYERALVKKFALQIKKHIKNENNKSKLQTWLKHNNLTKKDIDNISNSNIEAFIYSSYDKFPWVHANRQLEFYAYQICDAYNEHGWTVERPVFYDEKTDDYGLEVIIKNPELEHMKDIEEISNGDFARMAFLLINKYPLKQKICDVLQKTYPINEKNDQYDPASENNYYQDKLFASVDLVQKDKNFVFRTSIHTQYHSSSFNFEEDLVPQFTHDFPSYYQAIRWLALKLEQKKPVDISVNDHLLKKYPFCMPLSWPDAALDEKIRIDHEKGLSVAKIIKDCHDDYPLIDKGYIEKVFESSKKLG